MVSCACVPSLGKHIHILFIYIIKALPQNSLQLDRYSVTFSTWSACWSNQYKHLTIALNIWYNLLQKKTGLYNITCSPSSLQIFPCFLFFQIPFSLSCAFLICQIVVNFSHLNSPHLYNLFSHSSFFIFLSSHSDNYNSFVAPLAFAHPKYPPSNASSYFLPDLTLSSPLLSIFNKLRANSLQIPSVYLLPDSVCQLPPAFVCRPLHLSLCLSASQSRQSGQQQPQEYGMI